jgi:hypothetical protein
VIRAALLSLLLTVRVSAGDDLDVVAANPGFTPANQLRVSGNACGPAALLTAFGSGTERWRELGSIIPVEDERLRLTYIIRGYGSRQSQHLERRRWNRNSGIGLADLTDIANEMRGSRWLPKIRNEILLQGKHESQHELLRRAHSRLEKSFGKGLPPIISMQRLVLHTSTDGKVSAWHVVHGHFVTIVAMPDKLPRRATSFRIRYADPWGGRIADGVIRADDRTRYPALVADVPRSDIGKDRVKPGDPSLVVLSAVLGAL